MGVVGAAHTGGNDKFSNVSFTGIWWVNGRASWLLRISSGWEGSAYSAFYGVAINRLLKIIGLVCRIWSLL